MDIVAFFKEYTVQIIATGAMLILLPLMKQAAKKLVRKYGGKAHITKPRQRQIRQVIAVVLNITFILTVAIIWGVKPQNLLLGLSSVLAFVGVALFAQWSALSNVTAGLIMFFSAPYHVGNRITILDKDLPITATIEMIGSFYTHIRTDEDEVIVIPNNIFLQKMVGIKKDKKGTVKKN